MKKIIFLHLTGGPLKRDDKLIFTEGGLVHAVSASVNLIEDYQIEILCPNPLGQRGKKEINFRGVKITCLGGSQWLRLAQYGNLNFFIKAYRYIKNSNPDILIGNNLVADFLINFFPKRIKKVGIIHHLYLTLEKFSFLIWLLSNLEKLSFIFIKKLDAIGVVNPLAKEILIKKGYPENKIFFVGNGIDVDSFPFSFEKSKNSLIYIGRLAELKGVEDLIDVIFEIKKEIPKIKLNIVGSGPKRKILENKVEKLNLKNNVIFHGYLSDEDKIELLKESQIYLSASKLEGFGIPLIEAMAAGCVPIVNDIYAHRFIFQGKEVGYLIKNKKEMIKRIFELLKDENKRSFFAKNGRILVEEKWTWQKVGQNYKRMLENL